jgi:hypothetical protein
MTSLAASRLQWRPSGGDLLRILMTYVLPALAVLYVVLSGLWLVPDSFAGMYGNHDGHWASWYARGILEWSGFLDFSPFSPLVGTGSLFAPNLPWLNPGALALMIPAPLPIRHLASMLVYFAELSASLYLLYRHLEFSPQQSFLATILYVCIFFIPLSGLTGTLLWYALAPVNAHLIAAMNLATIAFIRVGYNGLVKRLLFGLIFLGALFIAFASAPMTSVTYVPIYAVLWIALLVPSRAALRAVAWRCGTIVLALLVLAFIGVPSYLAVTAMTSAREGDMPSFFHPGWRLLSPEYWRDLIFGLPFCSYEMQLMCPSTLIGWFEIAVLIGAIVLLLTGSQAKRRYGIAIVILLASIHAYALLSVGQVLGPLGLVNTPFLVWAFFPLCPPAAVAAGSAVAGWLLGLRLASSIWVPATASCVAALVAVFAWVKWSLPDQPRMAGSGPLGLVPIAHIPANKGPIVTYLQEHIGLKPGAEFRGYASTFLGARDGLVRKTTTPYPDLVIYSADLADQDAAFDHIMTFGNYLAARHILRDHFGNSFQMMDLWNNDIPTFEEYGQWVSKQMYYFNRDLLAQASPFPNALLLYVVRPSFLRALGVRFVIADGKLADPSVKVVVTETGKAGAVVNLYEIPRANLGQFSPTQVTWAGDYATAVRMLREPTELEHRAVLLGDPERQPELIAATRSRLVAVRDGYRLTASAPGRAMVVLPIQFSHCWEIEDLASMAEPPRLFRANIVQTAVLFKDNADVRLRFDFQPWHASCRFQDVRDLGFFAFK